MSAQRAVPVPAADQLLDSDTSAALLVWMETARVPDGISAADWDRWIEGECQGALVDATGASVTATMLGRWARSGLLR